MRELPERGGRAARGGQGFVGRGRAFDRALGHVVQSPAERLAGRTGACAARIFKRRRRVTGNLLAFSSLPVGEGFYLDQRDTSRAGFRVMRGWRMCACQNRWRIENMSALGRSRECA